MTASNSFRPAPREQADDRRSAGPEGPAVAPSLAVPPDRPVSLAVLLDHVRELGGWLGRRRAELEDLDATALRTGSPDSYSDDLVLAMALWQACSDRADELLTARDGGDLERATRLLRGPMDSPDGAGRVPPGPLPPGLHLSLADVCRLSDALATHLRIRLDRDPDARPFAVRLQMLRRSVQRCRELAGDGPSDPAGVEALAARVEELARTGHGDACLAVLRTDLVRAETDLLATAADGPRPAAPADRERASGELDRLGRRFVQVRELVDRCARAVVVAPRPALVDPAALGPVPTDRGGLESFLERLAEVRRVLDRAQRLCSVPLAELAELQELFETCRTAAADRCGDCSQELRTAALLARSALAAEPCDLDTARSQVRHYVELVRSLPNRQEPGHD